MTKGDLVFIKHDFTASLNYSPVFLGAGLSGIVVKVYDDQAQVEIGGYVFMLPTRLLTDAHWKTRFTQFFRKRYDNESEN